MKLLNKFSLINLLLMIFIFIVSSIIIYNLTQVILLREIDNDLVGIEEKINNYVSKNQIFPIGNPLDEERLIFQKTGIIKPNRNVTLIKLYSAREKKMHNFREITFPLFFNKQWYRVTIAKPLEGVHHLSKALLIVSLITILATILISLFLNRLYLRRLWQPFYESMSIMRNFKIGSNESLIFPRTNIEEFSFMNESLSIASEKAKQDFLLLKEFTENASHEMQTPLSIIRSKLDVLIQDKNLSEKQSELVQSSYASIKKLSRLNQSLLLLTKIENQQFDLKNQIDLKAKITQKINQFSELWDSYLIKSHIELNESCINMSPELLDILLNNLFSNAINHNITPGFIQIELNKRAFIIQNKGINDKLDDTRLFSRFYKASINSSSNGLGLSIVSQICKVSKIDLIYTFQSDLHSFSLSW